jgi:NAD(P)-dependent dehydrogenase (short-subunit alcohol dehydrogenase family)
VSLDRPLAGKVAIVTGASRGVGKGIAEELGAAGAVVYVSGRSVRGAPMTVALAGTVEETADGVTHAGGTGIAFCCDHRDDSDVRALFRRVEAERGRLDVLVNNVWGGYEGLHEGEYQEFGKPFWEQPLALWDAMFAAGVRAHYVASAFAARLMVAEGSGLIVNISSFAGSGGEPNVAIGVAKGATDRLTASTALQLREHGVAVVSVYPGLVRTEGVLKWAEHMDLSNSESPRFVGRAVAALAADPNVLERTGQVLVAAELAQEYGFTDIDGARPRSLRSQFEEVM